MRENHKLYKVLVFGMTENPGGVESFLMNYYRAFDRTKIHLDFLCNTLNAVAFEDELKAMGSTMYHIPMRRNNPIAFKRALKDVFEKYAEQYDAIWINVNSLANIDYLKMAKKYGIKRRIIHSHNAQNMDGFARGVLHKINRKRIAHYATDFWACSELAADWFYHGVKDIKLIIIRNAIDVDRLAFSQEARDNIRRQYALKDDYVLGNVGRLHFQKNQSFAIDVFEKFLKIEPKSKLVLIGQGPDEKKLKEKVASLGLQKKVLFAGVQTNISEWLSAFDLFLFPSKFEGLSISGLEAQANGVPVIASEGVNAPEIKINDNFHFFSLKASSEQWAQKISEIKVHDKREEKRKIDSGFEKSGFDLKVEAKNLEKLLIDG